MENRKDEIWFKKGDKLRHFGTIFQDLQVEVYRPIRQWWEWSMFKWYQHLDQFYIGSYIKPTRNWTEESFFYTNAYIGSEYICSLNCSVRWSNVTNICRTWKVHGCFWNPSNKFRTTLNIVQHEIYYRTRCSNASNFYRRWKFNIIR